MAPRPLINTSFLSPLHTTVSVQPNASIVQGSFLNGGVSKADIPYRSLAQFGVLSKYSSDPLLFSSLKHCFSVQTSYSNLWLLGSSMLRGVFSPSAGFARRSTSGYECLLFVYAWSENERSTPLTDAGIKLFSLSLFSYDININMVNIKIWSTSAKITTMTRNVEEWQSFFSLLVFSSFLEFVQLL